MRFFMCLGISALAVLSPTDAGEDKPTTRVEGTLTIPKDLPSFEGRLLEIRLYKHDPRIADTSADLVEKLDVNDFAHVHGKETTKTFVVGAKAALEPAMAYYVTCFILDKGKRTHIGVSKAGEGATNVLTKGNPSKIAITARAVK